MTVLEIENKLAELNQLARDAMEDGLWHDEKTKQNIAHLESQLQYALNEDGGLHLRVEWSTAYSTFILLIPREQR